MIRVSTILVITFIGLSHIKAQDASVSDKIQQVVNRFIEGLNKHDTIVVKKIIDTNVGLLTVFHDGNKNIIAAETADMLFRNITKSHKKKYHYEQASCTIETNNIIATAWCKYALYEEKKIILCGINAYQLYKTNKGWKIIQITNSRKSFNCEPLTHE